MKRLIIGCLILGSMSTLHAATISFNQGDYKLNIVNDSKFLLTVTASSAAVVCEGETRKVPGHETHSETVHASAKLKSQLIVVEPVQTQVLNFQLARTLERSTSELSAFLKNKTCKLSFQLVYQLFDIDNESLIGERVLIFQGKSNKQSLSFSQSEMPAELRFNIAEVQPKSCLTRFTLSSNEIFSLIDSLRNDPYYNWGSGAILCK